MKITDTTYDNEEHGYLMLHEDTLGITQKALIALRNALANYYAIPIHVFQVPAKDQHCKCYGFAIQYQQSFEGLVQTEIIGDGFRGDGSGEGGAGHRAAQALLAIWDITPIELLPEEGLEFHDVIDEKDWQPYRNFARKIREIGKEDKPVTLRDQKTQYPEWVWR